MNSKRTELRPAHAEVLTRPSFCVCFLPTASSLSTGHRIIPLRSGFRSFGNYERYRVSAVSRLLPFPAIPVFRVCLRSLLRDLALSTPNAPLNITQPSDCQGRKGIRGFHWNPKYKSDFRARNLGGKQGEDLGNAEADPRSAQSQPRLLRNRLAPNGKKHD